MKYAPGRSCVLSSLPVVFQHVCSSWFNNGLFLSSRLLLSQTAKKDEYDHQEKAGEGLQSYLHQAVPGRQHAWWDARGYARWGQRGLLCWPNHQGSQLNIVALRSQQYWQQRGLPSSIDKTEGKHESWSIDSIKI